VARVKSNGILMPILLHMLMNVVVIGVQYLVYINHAHQ
ncbi:CPBP family intramembrane metalloprotease, partial [Klebsiella pneumoniae]|nr:CPBP family intramembrane metalloprotease [Klebsiella pneumoniae]